MSLKSAWKSIKEFINPPLITLDLNKPEVTAPTAAAAAPAAPKAPGT
jgi:hypothetical protein